MAHDLSLYDFQLPAVEDWLAGDSRTLAFVVQDSDGNTVDISDATVTWMLADRPYQTDPADAVLSGGDTGVEVVTDSRVDSTAGEFEVRVAPDATVDLWGVFHQRPEVEQADGSVASWLGQIVLSA